MIKAVKTFTGIALVAIALNTTSCVKKDDFDDAPSTNVDPDIITTCTIDSLVSYAGAFGPVEITQDLVFSGVVVGDDKSGNYYKEMIIQDSTAGISILIDKPSYFTTYFVGRRIFVKAKGLYIQSVNGTPKIGALAAGAVDVIPSTLIPNYITGGKWGIVVEPRKRKVTSLTDADLNTLVQFDSVQFDFTEVGQPYADAVNKSTVNHYLQNCSGQSIIVRTSGYANFATQLIPCKAGSVKAIYQKYNSDQQVFLRDLSDVSADIERCDGNICETVTADTTYLTIDSIRTLFNTGTTTIPANVHILGTVTSDISTNMLSTGNYTFQDATGGICVRFTTNPNYPLNTQLDITAAGLSLAEYNGWLQINNTVNSTVITGLPAATPITVTLADLTANSELYESRLVKIVGATINNGTATTYGAGGNAGLPLSDGTTPNSVILYTRTSATFAATATPTTPVAITGVLTQFNTSKQLQIRSTNDVQ